MSAVISDRYNNNKRNKEKQMKKHVFRPDEYVSSVEEVDYVRLWNRGIRGLLYDIDNTLVTYDNPEPGEAIRQLFDRLRGMGFQIWIISNGRRERVTDFGEKLQVSVVWKAGKPFASGIRRAKKQMGLEKTQIAILGDQIFTDVWAGHAAGIYSILIKPISEEKDEWITKTKRGLEKQVLARYRLRPLSRRHGMKTDKALMKVDGHTQLLGLIGDPVAQTLSPFAQSLFIQEKGDNFAYVPLRVAAEDLEAALHGARAMHVAGLNVTVPHKQRVMSFLEAVDESARLVGAVNVLKPTATGFTGYNTDVDGFVFLARSNQAELAGKKVLLLGAGGAARAGAGRLPPGGRSRGGNLEPDARACGGHAGRIPGGRRRRYGGSGDRNRGINGGGIPDCGSGNLSRPVSSRRRAAGNGGGLLPGHSAGAGSGVQSDGYSLLPEGALLRRQGGQWSGDAFLSGAESL